MAKFWARLGVSLEIDDEELEGKSLEEVSQLLGQKIKDFKQRVDTENIYIEGDSYFPAFALMEDLMESHLLDKNVTEERLDKIIASLEFDF